MNSHCEAVSFSYNFNCVGLGVAIHPKPHPLHTPSPDWVEYSIHYAMISVVIIIPDQVHLRFDGFNWEHLMLVPLISYVAIQ